MHRQPAAWRRALHRFALAEQGVAAAEFALIMPLLISLYFGMVALTNAYAVKQRVEAVSRTVADLVGRLKDEATTGEIATIVGASAAIMAPYEADGMTITIASVVVRPSGTGLVATVCWSDSRAVGASGTITAVTVPADLAKGKTVAIPPGFNVASSAYVVSRVAQTYTPVVGESITGQIDFVDEVPWVVRNGQQIKRQGVTACATT